MKKQYAKPEITIEELQKTLAEVNEKLILANEKLEESNAKLEKAYGELKAREKERTELFANLSHDLRASVSVISGAAELLESELDPGTPESENAALIRKRARFLQSFIEDIFLLAKLEEKDVCAGEGNLRKQELREVDVRAFLEEYFISVRAEGGCGSRKLILEIPDDFSGTALMDPAMTVRVLDNLITNAKKYSPDGSVITLSVCADPISGKITISVSDTGIGIAPEDLPHIFERTFRAKRERPPEDLSSGLGLAIARRIVENAGGTIECESVPGAGSTFRFTLEGTGTSVTCP